MVGIWVMLTKAVRLVQIWEVNCGPRSDVWKTETGHPVDTEGLSAGGGSGGGEGNSLGPVCGLVDDGEDLCVTLGRWERTKEVNVKVGKPSVGNGDGRGRGMDVFVDFCFFGRRDIPEPTA